MATLPRKADDIDDLLALLPPWDALAAYVAGQAIRDYVSGAALLPDELDPQPFLIAAGLLCDGVLIDFATAQRRFFCK